VNARLRGSGVVAVVSNASRADVARRMGAELVLDPGDETALAQLRDLTNGRGVDATLDCSGSPQAHRLMLDAVRPRGRVAFVGESSQETILKVSPDLLRKAITLYGSWHYNLVDYFGVLEVIRRSPLLDLLVSHVFPMSRIQDAFETLACQQTAKVLLKPWE
jgi:L-iditol 2-dehydrogenase